MVSAVGEYRHDINRLRGVAIILVVVSHTMQISSETVLGSAISIATRGATWPFLFIAGFLMAHLNGRYGYATYLRKKASAVIAPYVLVVSLILIAGLADQDGDVFAAYLYGYPAAAPLWFVPVMIVFYLAYPLYSRLCAFPRATAALAVTSLAVMFWMGRPPTYGGIWPNVLFFQSAYLSGITYRLYSKQLDCWLKTAAPLLIVWIVTCAAFRPVIGSQALLVIPVSALFLVVLREETVLAPLLDWLAVRSFGIFFPHGIVTDRLPDFLGHSVNALSALLFATALVALSGITVEAIRKIAGNKSRQIIGA